MKKSKTRVCPRCGKRYFSQPALSRKDNKTKICPQCGTEEALIDMIFLQEMEEEGKNE